MGDSKTFGIPEAKGLIEANYLNYTKLVTLKGNNSVLSFRKDKRKNYIILL